MSAAALHGTKWIDADLPAELCRVDRAINGIVIHRDMLRDDEICVDRWDAGDDACAYGLRPWSSR